ncbi:helix-turn-helix domain-containing protein [Pedobacter sp. SYP-B3415]|uniref:AraC family transcriptional regulator n=1 Tax=Pedobacter sp. SYP-B3415 TaxID=2496641 RepID=UPI00101BE100|nr:helix-turn-helix domain-containing protein [Pedobacter sp. SYP-B3415]
MQIPSSPALKPYIRHYLFIEYAARTCGPVRLFPDGSCGMVFLNRKIAFSSSGGSHNLSGCFIYGQLNSYLDLEAADRFSIVVVVFQPWGLNRLTGVPAAEITDQIIAGGELFAETGVLTDQLATAPGCRNKVDVLEAFFGNILQIGRRKADFIVPESVAEISRANGNLSVAKLARYIGYSERQIERAFKEEIGISPKIYASITRLHHFIWLSKAARHSFTNNAYGAGYTDTSHLRKAFVRHTGITPAAYLSTPRKLAVNFISLSDS